jgi:hypothetical protein
MTFLDLLKRIQSDGPIEIWAKKTIVVKPEVFDAIVEEFEKLLAEKN